MKRAFPLPRFLSTAAGDAIAPASWGCHSCGALLDRRSCCQRAACWRFDERGFAQLHVGPFDEPLTVHPTPADVPAAHCASCCVHAAPAVAHSAGRAA